MTDTTTRESRTGAGVDSITFRNTAGHFATGVAVVGALDAAGAVQAMTVNSLTSVSLDPPLLLVCMARGARSLDAILSTRKFGVSILSDRQTQAALGYSRPREARSQPVEISHEIPLVPGRLAGFECALETTYAGGDHLIVLGRVLECHADSSGEPLLFCRGRLTDSLGKVQAHVLYQNWVDFMGY